MTSNTFTSALEPKRALFELSILNAECSDREFEDVLLESLKRNIPPEIVTRLKDLWAQTKLIAGEVIAIGKIIVGKIVDFLLSNTHVMIGIALGAVLSSLILSIPILGFLLKPLAGTVSAISTMYWAGVGASMQVGDNSLSPMSATIELAKKFFEMFSSIINGVTEYWNSGLENNNVGQ